MDAVVVVEVGVEGGGVTVYGRQVDGIWSFWQNGSSMGMDENDDIDWRGWESKAAGSLVAALPNKWWVWYPVRVHPAFVSLLRDEYDRRRAADPEQRGEYQHRNWMDVLARPG